MKTSIRSRCASFGAGLGLLTVGVSATAQESVQSGPAADASAADVRDRATVEQVVVTGSRIRQTAPTGSTLIAVEAGDIQAFPASNVVEALGRFPQVSGAGINEEVK